MLKIITPPKNDFEALYLKVREKEGRLYNIEEVKVLPNVPKGHQHFKEWAIRRAGLDGVLNYLSEREEVKSVLEIGCGNGWFSAGIAEYFPEKEITGCDLNMGELQLADQAFDLPNLHFIYADVFQELQESDERFDVVILPSSVQYFPDFDNLIFALWELSDEVHILDSPFYIIEDLDEATNRTRQYYHKLGFPQMAKMYFHHTYEDLKKYNPEFLYRPPTGWRKKFAKSPFPWIRLTKSKV